MISWIHLQPVLFSLHTAVFSLLTERFKTLRDNIICNTTSHKVIPEIELQ